MTTCSPLPGRTHELQHLLLQFTQKQLGNIYTFLVEQIAAIISSEESASAVVHSSGSAPTPLTTAPGCARDDDGNLRLQFYASAANITREIDGLLASRRRLQSTPCSSTVGTTVRPMHCCNTCCRLFNIQCAVLGWAVV